MRGEGLPATQALELAEERQPARRVGVGEPGQEEPPEQAESTRAPRLRDWIGVLAMGTGLFMAIMDVQIVTSS